VPSARRQTEIARLAAVLLTEYHEGTELYNVLQGVDGDVPVDATFTIDVRAGGNDLSGLAATLDAIQLAFDAAAVAFEFAQQYPDEAAERADIGVLEVLASSPIAYLEIVELSRGSVLTKVKAVFKHRATRNAVAGVASLTGIALHVLCPPLIIPGAILAAASPLTNLANVAIDLRHEKRDAARAREAAADRERKEAEARAREEAEKRDREGAAAREREAVIEASRRLAELYIERGGTEVDVQAIRNAKVSPVTIEVVDQPDAA
jgi:hypothetical protein